MATTMSGGFLQLHATEWNAAGQIRWSPNPPFTQATLPLYPENPNEAQTLEEEVLALTKAWYAAKGKKIPKAEETACLEMIEKEKAEQLKPIEKTAETSGPKADYGTKQYWAEYWAKKKAEGYVSKADQKKKDAEAKAVAKAEAAAAKEKAKADAAAAKEAAKEAAKLAKPAKPAKPAKASAVSSLTQNMAALSIN